MDKLIKKLEKWFAGFASPTPQYMKGKSDDSR